MIKNNYKNQIYYLGLILVVFLGLWFRIKGLGKWPLAVDEFYIVKSIENILKYGIPKFEAGGFYERGLIYQYITAFLIFIGIKTELAARIIPVISNILVLPPIFLLAKKISGKFLAFSITVLFCFSLWEVEFARFARMYAPFQALYIWYVYFLYRVVIEKRTEKWKWLIIISFVSIFVYEGGVFLLSLNFIPFIWSRKIKIYYFLTSIFLFVLNYIYIRTNFRTFGNSEILPIEVKNYVLSQPGGGGLIKIPNMLITTFNDNYFYWLAFALVLVATLFLLFKIYKNVKLNILTKVLFTSVVGVTLLNQFGLAIILLVCYSLLSWINIKTIEQSSKKYIGIIFSLHLSFWLVYCFFSNSWYQLFDNFEPQSILAIIKKIFVLFFNYSGSYSIFWLFYVTIPILAFFVILFFGYGIFSIISNNSNDNNKERFIYFVLTISLLMPITLISGGSTRYFFFAYPILLMLVVFSFEKFLLYIKLRGKVKHIAFSVGLILLLSISEDYNFRHLVNIDSEEVNFRINYNYQKTRHFYPRYDVRTPAEVINKHVQADDLVIINEINLEYYLNKLDYIFIDYRSRRFPILSTLEGTRERWTSAKLIYKISDLQKMLTEPKQTIWFMVHKKVYIQQPLIEMDFYNKFSEFLFYESIDKMVQVYRISK
jgi:hypothetical protein